ncbi:MAG: hypothetical protein Q9222_001425 [Ikaeria aurantiellina]
MANKPKAIVIGCFATRFVVIGAVAAQLSLVDRLRKPINITFRRWPFDLTLQFIHNLSIITVCIPYIRNVFVGLESGMLKTGDFHLHSISQPSAQSSENRHKPQSTQSEHISAAVAGAPEAEKSTREKIQEAEAAAYTRLGAMDVQNIATAEASSAHRDWDVDSQSSQAKIINKTSEWAVDYSRH